MLDYQEFTAKDKSLLIAPAGYGKTHTIAESIKHTEGKQLILTHTHAGVASIKEKLKKSGIENNRYNVETITSFAQKYVFSFCDAALIPSQEDNKSYYPFIIKKATQLLQLKPIRTIIISTYNGLFVDEYQDCTVEHHNLILSLSDMLSTRLLGDHLQGIFKFGRGSLVDMNNADMMGGFHTNSFALSVPWRWMQGNKGLGSELDIIRNQLLDSEQINLNDFKSIEKIITSDIYSDKSTYFRISNLLNQEQSLLIIHPDSKNLKKRVQFIQRFNNRCRLIESIDNKDFYHLSRRADSMNSENAVVIVLELCEAVFNKTGINFWFNDRGIKRKTKQTDKLMILPIVELLEKLNKTISFSNLAKILRMVSKLPEITCYRKELFSTLCKALEEAECNPTSVYDSMVNNRNIIRRVGRRIYGTCIGTTLLTKGLEFDTVVVLNANEFDCPKNLYVALSRATKKLIVISSSSTLNPY
jgi:hypothetical protein